jgi:pilus assembly protein CpaE
MTAVEHPIPTRRSVRVVLTGPMASDPTLEQALAERLDIDVIGRHADIPGAVGRLTEHEPEVVLHGIGATHPVGASGERIRADLRMIGEYTAAPVVLLVDTMSPDLLEEALEAGASDVVLLPLMLDTLPFAIHKASQGRGPADAGEPGAASQVVTVFSPKGGTGKTVLSTNLAAWLARRSHKRVLLIDLDLQFGDASMMLGVTPVKTIYDLVAAPGEMDEEKLAGFTTSHSSGIEILAAPLRPEEAEVVTEAKVRQIIEVARTAFDVVVLDTSPFFYGPLLATLDSTDRLLLLCGLDAPTMKNVRLGLRTLELLGFRRDRVDIVLNRVSPGDEVTRADVEGVLDASVRFELPQDPAVLPAVNRGEPRALLDDRSLFALAVSEIVASFVSVGQAEPPQRAADGLRRRLQGWRR